jgi:hypothetical protein
MITGLIKSIVKAGFLLVVPVAGLIGLIVFFGTFLTPTQRGVIFKDILSFIPGVRQFVSTQHKTRLNIQSDERENKLKTVYRSYDFLLSVKDKEGRTFIAIYPFVVEAGYLLDNVKPNSTEKDGRKILEITLPPPEILNVDMDDKNGALVLRDDLKGNHDIVVKPAKIAFEKTARDRVIKNGILEEADKKATEYYENFWKGVYDKVVVKTTASETTPLVKYQAPHLPVKFELNSEFKYQFYPSKYYNRSDVLFANTDDQISFGFSGQYRATYSALWDDIAKRLDENAYAMKFIDIDDPLNKATVCAYTSQVADCYVSSGEKLFFITHRPKTEELMKKSLGDVFYLSFSACEGDQNDLNYYEYLDHLNAACQAVIERNYSRFLHISRLLFDMPKGGEESKQLFSIAKVLQDGNFEATGDEDLDFKLQLLSFVKAGVASNIDEAMIEKARKKFRDNKNLRNAFLGYLLLNKKSYTNESARTSDISAMVQDGALSPELVAAISEDEFRRALVVKLKQLVKEENSNLNGLVFCGIDKASALPTLDCSNSFVYYDQKALVDVYKAGAKTVRTMIYDYGFDLDNHLVVVISHGFIDKEYDAFVFTKEGVWLKKNILGSLTQKAKDMGEGVLKTSMNYWRGKINGSSPVPEEKKSTAVFIKYTSLNMGGTGEEFTIEGRKYQKNIFTTLLDEICKSTKDKETGGSDRILCKLLEEELVNDAYWVSYVPKP